MTNKKALLILIALLLGGCLSNNGGSLDATSDLGGARKSRDRDDKDGGKPRQVCESTSIGGEPKTICY